MTPQLDEIARRLESGLGADTVAYDPGGMSAYAVDGVVPVVKCTPGDVEQISIVLRICAEAGAAVIPWGGGTAMHLGNVPPRADVVLSMARLSSLIEHDDANLTATAQGGLAVAAFQEILSRRRQFLPIDPPQPGAATVAGVVSSNANGPRRMLYGGVRDLVIGMKMVLAGGEAIKAGGKVVKNVAGYDMCKLFVGSLGTLGVITEVTCKMAPLPEAAATIVAGGTLEQAAALIDDLFASPLTPAALAVLSPSLAAPAGLAGRTPLVAVWAEGFTEAVDRHRDDLRAMAGRAGMTADVLGADAHRRLWDAVRDFAAPPGDGRILIRVTVPLGSVAAVLAEVGRADGAARYVGHAGSGTVWAALDDAAQGGAWFKRLAAFAQAHHGHAVLAGAPPAVKAQVDVWGPPPPSFGLMQELKRQFDPRGVLNPGRFVGRI